MRALDPRLAHYARATRTFLIVSVGLGVLTATLIVAQAWLLADVVSRAFLGGLGLGALRTPLIVLAAVVLARAGVAWAAELAAARSSARAKSQLRWALLRRSRRWGSTARASNERGSWPCSAPAAWTRSMGTSRSTCRSCYWPSSSH